MRFWDGFHSLENCLQLNVELLDKELIQAETCRGSYSLGPHPLSWKNLVCRWARSGVSNRKAKSFSSIWCFRQRRSILGIFKKLLAYRTGVLEGF